MWPILSTADSDTDGVQGQGHGKHLIPGRLQLSALQAASLTLISTLQKRLLNRLEPSYPTSKLKSLQVPM
jgi:hypothetical protein